MKKIDFIDAEFAKQMVYYEDKEAQDRLMKFIDEQPRCNDYIYWCASLICMIGFLVGYIIGCAL